MPRKKIDKLVEFAKVTVQKVLHTLQSMKMELENLLSLNS